MPAPIKPWEPSNIPTEIQAELNRRKKNRSFNYVDTGTKGAWNSATGDWEKYRGPMAPWVRLCSNGAGMRNKYYDEFPVYEKQGFVLFGGKDFYNGYGFNNTTNNPSIIGYMPDGTPHIIDNDLKTSHYPIHVPPPEIEKIHVTIQKELYRRAKVEFVCFSKQQLEYLTSYFFVPGITCILEWGWNLYNSSECLLDLTDTKKLKALNDNPYPLYTENILKSNGNYDVLFGRITDYNWSVEGNRFKCVTEITSQDRLYSGLVVDSKAEYDKKTVPTLSSKDGGGDKVDTTSPFGDLEKFVNDTMTRLIGCTNENNIPPELKNLKDYLVLHHQDTWRDYMFGVYTGPEILGNGPKKTYTLLPTYQVKESVVIEPNSDKDSDWWINLGLVMECINMHHEMLKSTSNNKKTGNNNQIFRVDIDDVVISGHPNLISTDGKVLLIPNAESPKYFYGDYGYATPLDTANSSVGIVSGAIVGTLASAGINQGAFKIKQQNDDYENLMSNSSIPPIKDAKTKKVAEAKKLLADYRLRSVCAQKDGAYRDDINELINHRRYSLNIGSLDSYAFPFKHDEYVDGSDKPYPKRYSGYLKNLYVNYSHLKKLIGNHDKIKTYGKLIEELMQSISSAAGDFWDFRLVSGPGSMEDVLAGKPATMKVVDNKFVNFINQNNSPFTFDYFDADSVLLGLDFNPTLSNAQAIRTIYAQTGGASNGITLTNGTNELLDPVSIDRLTIDNIYTPASSNPRSKTNEHEQLMRPLQSIAASSDDSKRMYQVTTKSRGGTQLVRRLVLPSTSLLKMLLDDGDEEQNPKYTGIMPGIQAQFTIQGIGGLRTFMMFLVRNLPEPYSEKNIVFRIFDIQDSIESGKWVTTITAGVIPLRNNIKARLGIDKIS